MTRKILNNDSKKDDSSRIIEKVIDFEIVILYKDDKIIGRKIFYKGKCIRDLDIIQDT